MSEHTPEPWEARLHEDPQWMVRVKGSPLGAVCLTSQGNDEANARHIVACVNACEGINPEAVPELLAASKAVWKWHNQQSERGPMDLDDALRTLVAAIAKAEKVESDA